MAQIIVEWDEAGNPTVSVNGAKGKSCKALSAPIEAALGKAKSTQPTPEFYQSAPADVQKIGGK